MFPCTGNFAYRCLHFSIQMELFPQVLFSATVLYCFWSSPLLLSFKGHATISRWHYLFLVHPWFSSSSIFSSTFLVPATFSKPEQVLADGTFVLSVFSCGWLNGAAAPCPPEDIGGGLLASLKEVWGSSQSICACFLSLSHSGSKTLNVTTGMSSAYENNKWIYSSRSYSIKCVRLNQIHLQKFLLIPVKDAPAFYHLTANNSEFADSETAHGYKSHNPSQCITGSWSAHV